MSEWPIEAPEERAEAVVRHYLHALAAQDWPALAATLDPDVERIGPYNDAVAGREAYAGFLADTLRSLEGYELRVARVVATDDVVVAELSETVDTPQGRRRTDEAIVFDVSSAGLIVRVSVYLRRSVTEQA
jgi:ketosteroid isomerase-like protein